MRHNRCNINFKKVSLKYCFDYFYFITSFYHFILSLHEMLQFVVADFMADFLKKLTKHNDLFNKVLNMLC